MTHTGYQTRSAINETTRRKTNNKVSKNNNFTAKTEYMILKAHNNNIKFHSDKALTTKNYFFLYIHQTKIFPNETG